MQAGGVDHAQVIAGQRINGARPEPQDRHSPVHRIMRTRWHQNREVRRCALLPGIRCAARTRGQQRRKVSQGTTVGQHACRMCRKRRTRQRLRCPANLSKHEVDDRELDARGRRAHLVDGHGIVGYAVDQRTQRAGEVGHAHLVCDVARMMKLDGIVQIAGQKLVKRRRVHAAAVDPLFDLQFFEYLADGRIAGSRPGTRALGLNLGPQSRQSIDRGLFKDPDL